MLLVLLACATPEDSGSKQDTATADADGDGYVADDCNEGDPSIHPDATESCDGVDEDCDGSVDEDAGSTWYTDADGDGWGDSASTTVACTQPSGSAAVGGDCDDADAAYSPGAAELCTDAVDYDCDGSPGGSDGDGDGWFACEDCDDADAAIHPDAVERCDEDDTDEDCDGFADDDDGDVDEASQSTFWRDYDGDDHGDPDGATTLACDSAGGYAAEADDCDDGDPDVFPGAVEVCDDADTDEDCDGQADDADADVDPDSLGSWHEDADGDGWGDASAGVAACDAPAGLLADGSDCDDADPAFSPDATEVCDGVDNDCDGWTDDEDVVSGEKPTWYDDDDGDGYGDPDTTVSACAAPSGYTDNPDDCDDGAASAHPGAAEVCDEADVDEDCDGLVDDADDDATGQGPLYVDIDADGYGGSVEVGFACNAGEGEADNADDCDDLDAGVNPGAAEVCDDADVDEDCDGLSDDDDSSVTGTVELYTDGDGDGYGDDTRYVREGCDLVSGLAPSGDCDDRSAAVNPDAVEVCDGQDNDCDGNADDRDSDVEGATWYQDKDGDGYGDDDSALETCEAGPGFVEEGGDCDDEDPAVSPAAPEICDGLDNDCDEATDSDDDDVLGDSWIVDADGDGWGGSELLACEEPEGAVAEGGDCDDGDAAVSPGATEVCDGADNDCDSLTDADDDSIDPSSLVDAWTDGDGDGWGSGDAVASCAVGEGQAGSGGDCDDADPAANPLATEVCDDLDNDCDGLVDDADDFDASSGIEAWTDADGDGWGGGDAIPVCALDEGEVEVGGDCDDGDGTVHPEAEDLPGDGLDADCDGLDCWALPDGAVAAWRGEGDGTDAIGANDGTVSGAYATGMVGEAFDFAMSEALVATTTGFPDTEATIELWVQPETIGSSQFLAGWGDPAAYEALLIGIDAGGALEATDGSNHLSGGALVAGSWHHAAVVNTADNATLYVDGVAVATAGLAEHIAADTSFRLANHTGSGWGPFAGLLDEVRVYDRALSAEEIAAIYAYGGDVCVE